MSDYGLKVSKTGVDVKTAGYKDLAYSSKFDTFKVHSSGTLELALPSETLNMTTSIRTFKLAHGLGYTPFFLPLARNIVYTDDLATGGNLIMNDQNDLPIPAGGYSPNTSGEVSRIYANNTEIVLEVSRYEFLGASQTFGARTYTCYYTIFYFDIEEAFNLIT